LNIGKMMKQAQQMQARMKEMQEELAALQVTGEAGGGMVSVTMNGEHHVSRVMIEDSLWAEQDKGMIEDLVAAACNHAAELVDQQNKAKQKDMMAGMPLPPGFSL
jgi:hypothetical protein